MVTGQQTPFRIMSFNIRYPNPEDGFNYWDNRKELVVSMLQFHEVDIVGVQEAFRRQLDEIKAAIPELEWFGVCRTDGTTQPQPDNEFSAILYRKDRFERLDGNTFWLSTTPEKVASRGWDAALPRIVTWAKFKDLRTEKIFFHFNTHFDHRGTKARLGSAKLLLEQVKTIAGDIPVVITGDFNCSDTEQPYRIMIDESNPHHFKDALTHSKLPHHGPLGSWTNGFSFPGAPGKRIDFVFVKNDVEVLKHAILSDSWSGRLPSDHLPVLAEVVVK
jgi:endonuclease/exonuclease/phosphatase family metal-dependent hydrolase